MLTPRKPKHWYLPPKKTQLKWADLYDPLGLFIIASCMPSPKKYPKDYAHDPSCQVFGCSKHVFVILGLRKKLRASMMIVSVTLFLNTLCQYEV